MSTVDRSVIVVGVDGSANSDRALDWASARAYKCGAGLHLVHALPLLADELPFWRAEDAVQQEFAEQVLAQARARARSAGAIVKTSSLVDQAAAPALIAAGRHALMVVLGARGHGAMGGTLLGSVSQHVSRHAACPVVVVREQADPHAHRVVVGVDGSAANQNAVEFAFDAASRLHAPLTAIHAWREHGRRELPYWAVPYPDARAGSGERILAEALAGWSEKYVDVDVTLEAIPLHPAQVLVDASRKAALVVVGSRGRGGFEGVLLGSVSQSLLHHARSPVAVVR